MKVTLQGTEYTLKSLSDSEYTEAERLARQSSVPLDVCPTCGGRDEVIPGSGGVRTFVSRTYRYLGEEYECECPAQMALRARYLLANIGDQYMRLNWDDYDGSPEARGAVATFLEKWESFKRNGFGLEFGGPLGVGKTFAATHIGKSLIKRGQRVLFCRFKDMVTAFEKENAESLETRMREATLLILDEIVPATSDRQLDLYSTRFEALIRHRTDFNLPTIITTNLSQEALNREYSRTYSLLAAKQMRIDLSGVDQRKDRIALENQEFVVNEECRPIT